MLINKCPIDKETKQVKVSVLMEDWSPAMSLSQIVHFLQHMIILPEPDEFDNMSGYTNAVHMEKLLQSKRQGVTLTNSMQLADYDTLAFYAKSIKE